LAQGSIALRRSREGGMRIGAALIRFAGAAWLFTAETARASGLGVLKTAPARATAPAAAPPPGFEPAALGKTGSGSTRPRIDSTAPQSGWLAFALVCLGAASTRGPRADRRSILEAALASVISSVGLAAYPRRASASYALYQASQASFDDRKKSGFVPVATSDRETLQEIQEDLNRKRPERMKRNAKVVYCAGDTAWVTPYLDNACTTFGASKADQTTGRTIEEMTGQATLPDYRRNLNM